MLLSSTLFARGRAPSARKVLILFLLLTTLLGVRVLTLMFMRAHLDDPAWFQTGSYAKFDRPAREILDGRQNIFLINDSTRTELAQYPPAFPALVALIYGVTDDRSAYAVQLVQWSLDLVLSFVLIVGITVTAFGEIQRIDSDPTRDSEKRAGAECEPNAVASSGEQQ